MLIRNHEIGPRSFHDLKEPRRIRPNPNSRNVHNVLAAIRNTGYWQTMFTLPSQSNGMVEIDIWELAGERDNLAKMLNIADCLQAENGLLVEGYEILTEGPRASILFTGHTGPELNVLAHNLIDGVPAPFLGYEISPVHIPGMRELVHSAGAAYGRFSQTTIPKVLARVGIDMPH